MTDLERLQWEEWERRSIEKDLINTGIKQGIEQNTIDVIKSMLENNLDYETISKVTNKTIDEIKEIETSIKPEE